MPQPNAIFDTCLTNFQNIPQTLQKSQLRVIELDTEEEWLNSKWEEIHNKFDILAKNDSVINSIKAKILDDLLDNGNRDFLLTVEKMQDKLLLNAEGE